MQEIESSGRAANSARCARAFLSLCPNRDRVGLRQPRCLPDDGPDVGGGVRTELEANLNRRRSTRTIPILVRQSRTTASATTLQRPAMTVTSRNLQVITGREPREGARERVWFAPKPIAATKIAMRATQQPQRGGTTSCASRPSAGIDLIVR